MSENRGRDEVSNGKHILRDLCRTKKQCQQEGAERRRIERQNRTAMQQLALLDERLGKDVGAKKERTRLVKFIASHPDTIACKKFARYP